MRQKRGFTLVELMLIIVIIGVLAMLALPNYRTYTNRSKMAEAYRIMNTIVKSELTYFYENKEFFDLSPNPSTLNGPMLITSSANWSIIGYPAIVGSYVNFNYRARAGKTDGTGTELTTSTVNGNSFIVRTNNQILESSYTSPSAATCNSGLATPASLGVLSQNNYDWVVVTAVGDLKGNMNSSCTGIALVVDVASENPGSRGGFAVFNEGE